MSKIFKGLIVFLLVFTVSASMAQTKEVSGRVADVDGAPVAGATVRVVGGRAGTATDANGEFKFNVLNQIQAVTVSALGYQEKTVSLTGGFLDINLERGEATSEAGSEVVVTALGVSREKKSLGYATQTISSEELNQAANTSVAGALQGKTAGVEIKPSSGMPGASSLITIRGARSFTGDNSPLYVVDGMPISSASDLSTGNSVTGTDYANRAIDLDPNDIASIEILKGQAASALYGIKASNGVVVITTKSGKGIAKGKAQITFNSNTSFDRISRYPDLQTTYAQGTNGAYSPSNSSSWGPKITDLPNDPAYGGNVKNKYTDTAGLKNGMYFVPQRLNAGLNPWVTPHVYNNIKDFFLTGKTFSNTIGVAQAKDDMNYSFSLGNTNQTGIVPNTGLNRFNAKLTAEARLSSKWKTSFSGNFINSNIDKMPSANDGIMATIFPAPPSYDLKGIPDHYLNNEYKPNGYRGGAFVNPYWGTKHNSFNEKTNRFFGNSNVTYSTVLDDNISLDVKYQIGADAYTTNYQDIWSYGMPSKGSKDNGTIEEYSFTNTALNSLLTANLRWKINQDLNFSALYGNEISNTETKYVYAYGSDFAFAGFNHMNNTGTKDASETSNRYRGFGNFANLSFDYQRMLYLNLTGRVDRVSEMPNGNRTFFYPSASLAFVFSELSSLKNNSVLNFGKLRVSYAQVGQAGRYLNNYYDIPAYGGGFYGGTPILYPINGLKAFVPYDLIYDPNLKPQNTISYEAGLDLNFLNDLIQFTYTFSRQNVKDQIFDVPLATSTGASALRTNGGAIHTNAHEATLNVFPIREKNISWNVGVNFYKIDNYVDKLAPGVENIFLGGFVTPQVRAGIGDKFPVIYGNSFMRNDNGQVIVDSDGIPIPGEPAVIGRVSPDFILGFNTSFRYKIATLSAVFDWKNGGQMYSGSTGLFNLYGVSRETAEARDKNSVIFPNSVKEDGTPNTQPITGYKNIQNYFQTINNIDESSIVNSSFLKMREIALRLDLLQKKNFNLGLNLFARNILLWTNSPYLDPESSQGNTNMGGAFERFTLPQTSSYGFGLNLQF